ncbi:hypothetical protein GOBAR_AA04035 [Gossypium barbadense]|uniref:Glycosyltransferase n=1 Tax=Gossypium barbadense TaxID=3634 RepID=A0A2P5YLR2_GOSBA|nr:hypothetical protein GOBAR_AA04035 [Gossypium barbadense]
MVDIGRLLAQRGVTVTIVTTPYNAGRVQKSVARAIESGLPIRLLQLQFPGKEVGLPDGVENIDMLHSMEDLIKFVSAANKMEEAMLKLFEKLTPRPNCIISDINLFYTRKIASKFQVPKISFHGFCCFCLLCLRNIQSSKINETVTSDSEYFTVPGLTDKVEFTRVQLPLDNDGSWKEIFEPMWEADRASYGVVINTFEELESAYVKEYRKEKKAWCIGPVSLSHKDELDMAERGNKASIDGQKCLKWLDSQQPGSVIYACLGSIGTIKCPELIELGLGLEASNKPFIWVLRGNNPTATIGGFVTHCGWNSIIEGISAGVPLITFPFMGDQFCNEKLAVQILKIGVNLGEHVKNAIDKLMEQGNEGTDMRKRAKELGDEANKAVEVGGSSYMNITLLIQDILQQSQEMR